MPTNYRSTPATWAADAFEILKSEWAKQVDWEVARGIKPHSERVRRLEAFLMSAPDSVKREVIRRENARRSGK